MSDRLTNMEIQDVLSSIRRLVSEDNRHRDERVTRGRSAMASAEDGKLVLTEALRVAEPEPEPAKSPAAAETPRTADDDEGLRLSVSGESRFDDGALVPPVTDAPDAVLADAPTLEDTIAELEAAVSRRGWDFEPDGSEVKRGALADAGLEEAFEESFGVDEAAEDDEADLSQPITAEIIAETPVSVAPSAEPDMQEAVVEAPVAEPVEPDDVGAEAFDLAPQAASAEAETGPADPAFLRAAAVMAARTGTVPWARRPGTAAEPAPEPLSSEAVIDAADDVVAPEAAPAEEATRRPSRIRRLTLMPSDRADTAEEIADEQLADISPALPGADAGDGDETEASLFSAGDETVVDMDMLRDLVAEIIRQELQGSLGERITRNVRMLVRREVNRALEGRNFE